MSYQKIAVKTGVAKSTASSIFRHTVKNVIAKQDAAELRDFLAGIDAELRALKITNSTALFTPAMPTPTLIILPVPAPASDLLSEEFSLLELISKDCLDPDARSGRPKALSEEEKDQLVATVKRDFNTRRMKLVDLRREAELSHVCDTTVYNALYEHGIKAYQEEFKFILSPENKATHMVSTSTTIYGY